MIQEDEPNCSKPQFKSYSSGRRTKISQQEHKSLKNECLSKRGLHRSQAPGPTKENGYTKKKKIRHQANRDEPWNSGARRKRRRRMRMGLSRSTRPLGIVRRGRFLLLFITGEVKIEVQIWVHVNSFPLKSEPPRSPLSTGLISQLSNNLIPLSNHTNLLMEIGA